MTDERHEDVGERLFIDRPDGEDRPAGTWWFSTTLLAIDVGEQVRLLLNRDEAQQLRDSITASLLAQASDNVCDRCGRPRYAVYEGPLLDRHREICNPCYRITFPEVAR